MRLGRRMIVIKLKEEVDFLSNHNNGESQNDKNKKERTHNLAISLAKFFFNIWI